MRDQVELVPVSELAHAVGFRPTHGETGWTVYLLPEGADSSTPMPIYFTRALWRELGGEGADTEMYEARARALLIRAQEVYQLRMVVQRGWRAGFALQSDDPSRVCWMIAGHSYSDGLVLGHGPGDFWS